MFIEIFLFSLVGVFLGVVLGLLPGLHLNNLLPIFLSLTILIPNPYLLIALIISAAIAQVFTSFIPSIFLGAPDGDNNSLAVLPGHRLLLEGRGYEAIKLTVIGGVTALIISIIVVLFFGNYFASVYNLIRPFIAYPLITVIILMILSERHPNKMFFSALVILLSGILGILVLNSSIVPQQNALFPTFAGLFAISTLLISIAEKSKIPKQQPDAELKISKLNMTKSIIFAVIAGILIGLLPAVGVSQAATFMQYIGGLGEARAFLVTLSGINIVNEVISLNSLYLISNPRSGASVAIESILPQISFYDMLLFIGIILFTTGITVPITLYLGRIVPSFLVKLNYTVLSLGIIGFLLVAVALATGVYGLLVAFTSTAIGLSCAYLGVKRSNCMGVLLLPSILFFTGLNPLILTFLNI